MNRHVVVRGPAKPPRLPLYQIHFPKAGQDVAKRKAELVVTRIWMGAVPPEGQSPAYACVVVELYSNNPAQRDRTRIMLDEAVALDPGDFTEKERAQYRIHDREMQAPTLNGFRRALVALKDLYRPNVLLVPPGHPQFKQTVALTEGLSFYDARQKHLWDQWFPFFKDESLRLGPWEQETEDREHNNTVIDNLYAQDRLKIGSACNLYRGQAAWTTPRRALGMVLAAMQDKDMTFVMRQWKAGEEGYVTAQGLLRHQARELTRTEDEIAEGIAAQLGAAWDRTEQLEAEHERDYI